MNRIFPIIGMEVHAELSTKSKMFCGCPAWHFKAEPNTQVCPVCLGLPGALPVPNKLAIENTVKLGLGLGCQINLESKFDRKHYFYPDLPKGYQISQYDQPLCQGGALTLGSGKKVRIERVHLEEDTAKLIHREVGGRKVSLIDYNRSGVPLVEIVSEPDLSNGEEVREYLRLVQATVRYLGLSDADMEKGSMRLEANVSVSRDGQLPDYKVEIKNINSFRFVTAAIEYELERQKTLLAAGKGIVQETRGWSAERRVTVSQRRKEAAKDYRYFPEPDIPPLVFDEGQVNGWREELPVLPSQAREALVKAGVRLGYAQTVIEDHKLADYVLKLIGYFSSNQIDNAVGWIVNKKIDWKNLSPEVVADTIKKEGARSWADSDTSNKMVEIVFKENDQVVADIKAGKVNAINVLIGKVIKKSQETIHPLEAEKLIRERLK